MALVPDTVWGLRAHPRDSTGEALPQNHLGLPQARKASWENQTRIPHGCTPTPVFGVHTKAPSQEGGQTPHLGSTSSLPVSLRSVPEKWHQQEGAVLAEAVAPQNHRVAGCHLWDHMAWMTLTHKYGMDRGPISGDLGGV